MTRKIYKKLPPVNSEEGEVKCVQNSGLAAVTLYLNWEAGMALEPGETEIIKYTQQFQAHAICIKGSLGYAVILSQAVETPTGPDILKTSW